MIRRDRSLVARPAALDKPYGSGSRDPKLPGKTERESAVQAFHDHVAAGGDPVKFKYPFERYKSEEVKRALAQLFRGKCAYCESFVASTQPMDVEHFRPKGEVHEILNGMRIRLQGYYWLAAEWENLLPSCIDCNRARTQRDVTTGKSVRLGKANLFPVRGRRATKPDDDLTTENALILDPCSAHGADDPAQFFRFTEEGIVLAAHDDSEIAHRERAVASIKVFGLNRSELVMERLATRRLVDHRIGLIGKLHELRSRLSVQAASRDAKLRRLTNRDSSAADEIRAERDDLETLVGMVDDLIAYEIDALQDMIHPNRPFSLMVRQMLEEARVGTVSER